MSITTEIGSALEPEMAIIKGLIMWLLHWHQSHILGPKIFISTQWAGMVITVQVPEMVITKPGEKIPQQGREKDTAH